MNLRQFYEELARHPNHGLSGATELRLLVGGESIAVRHIYYNGRDLMILAAPAPAEGER